MQQHGSKYFARRPLPFLSPPTLGMGSVGQNSTFSEHGHVGYEIKVPVDKHDSDNFTPGYHFKKIFDITTAGDWDLWWGKRSNIRISQ